MKTWFLSIIFDFYEPSTSLSRRDACAAPHRRNVSARGTLAGLIDTDSLLISLHYTLRILRVLYPPSRSPSLRYSPDIARGSLMSSFVKSWAKGVYQCTHVSARVATVVFTPTHPRALTHSHAALRPRVRICRVGRTSVNVTRGNTSVAKCIRKRTRSKLQGITFHHRTITPTCDNARVTIILYRRKWSERKIQTQ